MKIIIIILSCMTLMLCSCAKDNTPSTEDAKKAFAERVAKSNIVVTKFERVNGGWEMENVLYKMDVAVEGTREGKKCERKEMPIRLHKMEKGWKYKGGGFGPVLCREHIPVGIKVAPIDLSGKK